MLLLASGWGEGGGGETECEFEWGNVEVSGSLQISGVTDWQVSVPSVRGKLNFILVRNTLHHLPLSM